MHNSKTGVEPTPKILFSTLPTVINLYRIMKNVSSLRCMFFVTPHAFLITLFFKDFPLLYNICNINLASDWT
jgi:hypothetical protein